MPSSDAIQISQIMQLILETKPNSVLDIGVGFGKYGFLCREYLELWDGRNIYGDWKHRIDGVEVYKHYITSLQNMIYDNIYIGNALYVLNEIDLLYDMILLIDILEHFTYKQGKALLNSCKTKGKSIIISTPKKVTPQKAVFGNVFEEHRFQWKLSHFKFLNFTVIDNPKALILYILT